MSTEKVSPERKRSPRKRRPQRTPVGELAEEAARSSRRDPQNVADERVVAGRNPGQKVDIMLGLQQTQGNARVQRLVARKHPSKRVDRRKSPRATAEGQVLVQDEEPARAHDEQKTHSGEAAPAVETTTQTPATSERVIARFGPYAPETFKELLSISRTLIGDLRQHLAEIEEGAAVRLEAEQWIAGLQAWVPEMERRGDEPLTQFAAVQAAVWYEDLLRLRAESQAYKRRRTEEELERARAAVAEAAARFEARRPELDDAMRRAFLKGDKDTMAAVANSVAAALSTGMALHELARDIAEALARVQGQEMPPVGRYVAWLDRINKVLAGASLIYSLAKGKPPTELGTAINGLNTVANAFSAGSTLLGLAPHISLYATLYLAPLTEAVTAQLETIISTHLHEFNVVAVELGESPDMSHQPGGWPMYDFMIRVMQADDLEGVPWPVPKEAEKFLLEQRDLIQTGARSELPTTGWWFWRALDPARVKSWIYDHRQALWAMLYGRMSVPSPKDAAARGARR